VLDDKRVGHGSLLLGLKLLGTSTRQPVTQPGRPRGKLAPRRNQAGARARWRDFPAIGGSRSQNRRAPRRPARVDGPRRPAVGSAVGRPRRRPPNNPSPPPSWSAPGFPGGGASLSYLSIPPA